MYKLLGMGRYFMEYGVFYKAIAGLLRCYCCSFGPTGVKINKNPYSIP
jgi:hypothetical protein